MHGDGEASTMSMKNNSDLSREWMEGGKILQILLRSSAVCKSKVPILSLRFYCVKHSFALNESEKFNAKNGKWSSIYRQQRRRRRRLENVCKFRNQR